MSGLTTTYDPAQVLVAFLGNVISGFMDGTFISVERDEDAFALKVGADGETARAKNNNRAGKVVLTLMQSSPSNDVLANLGVQDEANATGIGSFSMRDNLGHSEASSPSAYISKMAKIERGKEILGVEWTFTCPVLNQFTGGAIQLP